MVRNNVLRPPVELMRPTRVATVPAEDAMAGGTLFQIKIDGFRAAVFNLPGDGPRIQGRSGSDLTWRFPELIAPIAAMLPVGAVLDGEVCAFDGHRFAFEELLRTPAGRAQRGAAISFVAFDLLALRVGAAVRDVRGLPLRERWAALAELMHAVRSPLELIMATTSRPEAMVWYDALLSRGVEGIVAKAQSSRYRPRTGAWVKVRHSDTSDAEAIAVVGSEHRPKALLVRLPDGREMTTSPALDALQAHQVAAAAQYRDDGSSRFAQPLPVEVRIDSGRHAAARFVRVRGE